MVVGAVALLGVIYASAFIIFSYSVIGETEEGEDLLQYDFDAGTGGGGRAGWGGTPAEQIEVMEEVYTPGGREWVEIVVEETGLQDIGRLETLGLGERNVASQSLVRALAWTGATTPGVMRVHTDPEEDAPQLPCPDANDLVSDSDSGGGDSDERLNNEWLTSNATTLACHDFLAAHIMLKDATVRVAELDAWVLELHEQDQQAEDLPLASWPESWRDSPAIARYAREAIETSGAEWATTDGLFILLMYEAANGRIKPAFGTAHAPIDSNDPGFVYCHDPTAPEDDPYGGTELGIDEGPVILRLYPCPPPPPECWKWEFPEGTLPSDGTQVPPASANVSSKVERIEVVLTSQLDDLFLPFLGVVLEDVLEPGAPGYHNPLDEGGEEATIDVVQAEGCPPLGPQPAPICRTVPASEVEEESAPVPETPTSSTPTTTSWTPHGQGGMVAIQNPDENPGGGGDTPNDGGDNEQSENGDTEEEMVTVCIEAELVRYTLPAVPFVEQIQALIPDQPVSLIGDLAFDLLGPGSRARFETLGLIGTVLEDEDIMPFWDDDRLQYQRSEMATSFAYLSRDISTPCFEGRAPPEDDCDTRATLRSRVDTLIAKDNDAGHRLRADLESWSAWNEESECPWLMAVITIEGTHCAFGMGFGWDRTTPASIRIMRAFGWGSGRQSPGQLIDCPALDYSDPIVVTREDDGRPSSILSPDSPTNGHWLVELPPERSEGLEYVHQCMLQGVTLLLSWTDNWQTPLVVVDGWRSETTQAEGRRANCSAPPGAPPDFDVAYEPTAICEPLRAIPGRSRHQMGYAVDLNCWSFTDPCYQWLKENATKFGLCDPVPREPWHWQADESPLCISGGNRWGLYL